MNAGVETLHRLAPAWIRFIHQKEAGDGPDSIQFGLAVDQVFEIGRYFDVRNDAAQGIRREVRYIYNVRRVDFFRRDTVPTVWFHGANAPGQYRRPKSMNQTTAAPGVQKYRGLRLTLTD